MIINEQLEKRNLTKYRLSKESGIPQATINDICSGKADIEKCAAGTLYRLAKVLGISIEEILDSAKDEYRSAFETFKSNTCHQVKEMGDVDLRHNKCCNKDAANVISEDKHRDICVHYSAKPDSFYFRYIS